MQKVVQKEHIEATQTSDANGLAQQEIYMVVRQKAALHKKSKGKSRK